ncbi:MAG: GNAT family N-acetyltransferase [Usitatibacter sp.]
MRIVRDRALIREAQKLRYQVFAEEMGARLGPPAGPRIDEDRFDIHCEHLVVRDTRADQVVGTYRILAPDAAKRARGYYAEEQFDLGLLEVLRDRMVEVGRACVHPDYRTGGVMLLLWSNLARYLIENGHDYVMGCASVGLADGGHTAASVFRALAETSMSPDDYRVFPRRSLPLERLRDTIAVEPPPLLRGYLNMGAWVCGEPAWDRDFNCADLPTLLPLARMRGRYVRHFLANAA